MLVPFLFSNPHPPHCSTGTNLENPIASRITSLRTFLTTKSNLHRILSTNPMASLLIADDLLSLLSSTALVPRRSCERAQLYILISSFLWEGVRATWVAPFKEASSVVGDSQLCTRHCLTFPYAIHVSRFSSIDAHHDDADSCHSAY